MPQNYANFRLVDPVFSGFMATTKPKQEFIGRKITPRIRVNSPDYVGKIFVDTHTRSMGDAQTLLMAPGAPHPKMSTADPSSVTYTCEMYGVASDGIPKVNAGRSQLPVDLVQREMGILMDRLLIAEEIRYATLYQTSGNWTTTVACSALTGQAQWSSATATPLVDLHAYLETYHAAAHGNFATDIIIPYAVAVAMARTNEVRGVVSIATANGTAMAPANRPLSVSALKALIEQEFGLKVHIPAARKNTANMGQTHAEAYVFTDTVWLGTLMADAVADGANIRTVATAALGVDEISPLAEAGLAELGSVLSAGVDELSPTNGNAWVPYCQQSADELRLIADFGATITDCLA